MAHLLGAPDPTASRAYLQLSGKRADILIEGIVEGEFPARPEATKCRTCDMRAICKHAKCGKYDF
jgi:hypothetical protein